MVKRTKEEVDAAIHSYLEGNPGPVQLSHFAAELGISRERARQLRGRIQSFSPDRPILTQAESTATTRQTIPNRRRVRTDTLVSPYLHEENLTQQDIANITGVSLPTVSRSMRRQGVKRGWGPETQERIRTTLEERGTHRGGSHPGFRQTPEHVAKRVASTQATYAKGEGRRRGRKPRQ